MPSREEYMTECVIQEVTYPNEHGWSRVKTDKGPFSTKLEDLIREANSLIGKRVKLWYTEGESSGRINPHSGKPYPPDRYYSRASSTNGTGSVDMVAARGESPERTWRIALQAGGHLALDTLPYLPVDQRGFENQKAIALAWAKWFYYTPVPPAMIGSQMPEPMRGPEPEPEPAAVGAFDEPQYEGPPPPGDDDAPF